METRKMWQMTDKEFSTFLSYKKCPEVRQIAKDLQKSCATAVHLAMQYVNNPYAPKNSEQLQKVENLTQENTTLQKTIAQLQEKYQALQKHCEWLQQENQDIQERNTILSTHLHDLHKNQQRLEWKKSPEHQYIYEKYIRMCDEIPINELDNYWTQERFHLPFTENMEAFAEQEKEIQLMLHSIAYWWCVKDNKKFLALYAKKSFPNEKIVEELVNFMDRVIDIHDVEKYESINWQLMQKIRNNRLSKKHIVAFVTTPGAIFMKDPFPSKKEYINPHLEEKFHALIRNLKL